MTVLLAVLVVGIGSFALRAAPLLGARHLPDRLTEAAGWAGLAVIAAITVRAVLRHHDTATPGAPLVAAVAVAAGLWLAFRGRSVLLAVAVGCAAYVALATALPALLPAVS